MQLLLDCRRGPAAQISSQQAMAAPALPSGHHLSTALSAWLNLKTAFLLAQRRAFCQCLCAPGGSSPFVLNTRSSLSSRSDTRPSVQLHHLPLPSRGTWLQTPQPLPTSIVLYSSRTKTEAGKPRVDHTPTAQTWPCISSGAKSMFCGLTLLGQGMVFNSKCLKPWDLNTPCQQSDNFRANVCEMCAMRHGVRAYRRV